MAKRESSSEKASRSSHDYLIVVQALSQEIRKGLVDLYDYNFFDEEFCGACAVASWLLVERARACGIRLRLVVGPEHSWCEFEDGTVVDPTYSQYALETPIWIGCRSKYHTDDDPSYDVGIKFDDEAHEVLSDWPEEQNPLSAVNAPVLECWLESLS